MGVLQGATEFLPVSSSGHLSLAQNWLHGVEEPQLLFQVVVHLGTLIAIVVLFRVRIWGLLVAGVSFVTGPGRVSTDETDRRWVLLILAASLPTAILGLLLRDSVRVMQTRPAWVGVALLTTAALLLVSERLGRRTRGRDSLGFADAVLVGAAQGLGVLPGLSRSGVTVAAALWRDARADVAVEFSLLVSVPAVLGANLLELAETGTAAVRAELVPLLVGFTAAFATGIVSIKALQWVVVQRRLLPFALYCALVGGGAVIFG